MIGSIIQFHVSSAYAYSRDGPLRGQCVPVCHGRSESGSAAEKRHQHTAIY